MAAEGEQSLVPTNLEWYGPCMVPSGGLSAPHGSLTTK